MFKFFKSRSKVTVKVTSSKFMFRWKGLVIRYSHAKYEKSYLLQKKLWPMLKFVKSRSKVMAKVTSSKFMVPLERSVHKDYTCQI